MSLNFLNGIYYLTLSACWLVGASATVFITQFTAGVALVAVWLARVVIDAQCEVN
jgi:hypothetical protein